MICLLTGLICYFLREEKYLWHPESPGVLVRITRSPFEEHFKPRLFATNTEVIRSYKKRL